MPSLQAGAWEKAERELLQGLAQFDRSAVLSNALGMVYEKENKKKQARQAFERATEWLPGFTAAQLHLATLFVGEGDCAHANPLLADASSSTTDPGALSTAASGLAECKDYSLAATVLERAHKLDPQSTSITFNLALARFESGAFAPALAALESLPAGAEQISPDVMFLRGKLLRALNKPGAAEQMAAACHNRPDQDVCNEAASELIRNGRLVEAADLVEHASKYQQPSAELLSTLGLAQFRLGRHREAIESYSNALKQDQSLIAAREGLAFLIYVAGDLNRARSVVEAGLKGSNPHFYLLYLRSLILYRISRDLWPEALSSINLALNANPNFAPSYFLRGKLRMQEGSLDAALDDFKTAVRLDPKYAAPFYKMSQIYERQGAHEQAKDARQQFLTLGSLREEDALAQQAIDQLGRESR